MRRSSSQTRAATIPEPLFPPADDATASMSRSYPPTLPFPPPYSDPFARAPPDIHPYAPTPSSRTSYLSPLPRLDTASGFAASPPSFPPAGSSYQSSWSAPPDFPTAYARETTYADSWRSLPPSFPPAPSAALPRPDPASWLPTTTTAGMSTSPTQAWATRSPVASTSSATTALRGAQDDDWLLPTARWPSDADYDWDNGHGEPDF